MFLCILLLYYIIDNVYTLRKENVLPQDNYNKLIEAQNIIETASKSIANKEVFSSSITKAKKLVEEVKASNQLVKETQDLDLRISTIEKQFNGIETIEIEKRKADIVLNPTEITLIEIFEYNKKLYVV
jgi:chaperonin cofactor prefoldin